MGTHAVEGSAAYVALTTCAWSDALHLCQPNPHSTHAQAVLLALPRMDTVGVTIVMRALATLQVGMQAPCVGAGAFFGRGCVRPGIGWRTQKCSVLEYRAAYSTVS